MKNTALLILLLLSTKHLHAAQYHLIKGHTDLAFSVKHMLISNTRGVFKEFKGDFQIDSNKVEVTNLFVEIEANSIFTNDNDRDGHLKNSDFLEVQKYPTIKFKIDKIKYLENTPIKTSGKLTIKDIEKTIPVTITFTGFKTSPFDSKVYGGFTLKSAIDRKDFGMTFNKTLDQGGLAIGNEVDIDISGEFTKK